MTAAEYQAQFGQKGTTKRAAPARPPKSQPALIERSTAPENNELPNPHYGTPGGPCAWLLPGGQVIQLAGPALGEDRMRVVITGQRDMELLKTLLTHLLP